jgi:hypothetical protein
MICRVAQNLSFDVCAMVKMTQIPQKRQRIRRTTTNTGALVATCLLLLLLPLVAPAGWCCGVVTAFTSPVVVVVVVNPASKRMPLACSLSKNTALQAASSKNSKKKSNSPSILPRNEFSRTVQPDRLVRSSSSASRGGFRMSLEANATECLDLARRFDGSGSPGLTSILKLQAEVTLRQESLGGGSGGTAVVGLFGGIEAQGTVTATITQTCVRTNEKFPVDLEFPLYAIVRPSVVTAQQYYNNDDNGNNVDEVVADETADYSKSSHNNKKRKKSSYRGQNNNNNNNGDNLLQLQRMMQEDISIEDDALVQDESIYCSAGGGGGGGGSFLDVGELVTQLFFLQIDPYPKMPGTSPVQRSISSTTSVG